MKSLIGAFFALVSQTSAISLYLNGNKPYCFTWVPQHEWSEATL